MILNTFKFIVEHPLNRDRKSAALRDWFCWQVGSRMLPGAVEVPFVNEAVLIAEPGMTGATGNIYCGLAEFEDMSFLLHCLQPNDLFVDVGANVGSYAVLASKSVGATSIAIEALPTTYNKLMRNIRANDILARVEALNCALGEKNGEIYFTSDLDTMNHAVSESGKEGEDVCIVPVRTLDDVLAGRVPRLIKIDVEGYETPVIEGAKHTLNSPDQEVVIMELNGCGSRYGFSDDDLHQEMLNVGYIAVHYNPFERKILQIDKPNVIGNTLYLKSTSASNVQARLKNAACFCVKGRYI